MLEERVLRKGPPPHVGWWNASLMRSPDSWRWWNGCRWSHVVSEFNSADDAADMARIAMWSPGEEIEWTDYYPANARVPRVNPQL